MIAKLRHDVTVADCYQPKSVPCVSEVVRAWDRDFYELMEQVVAGAWGLA